MAITGDALGWDWDVAVPLDTGQQWRWSRGGGERGERSRDAWAGEGDAGPSDYARRAWTKGIGRDRARVRDIRWDETRRVRNGEIDVDAEAKGDVDGEGDLDVRPVSERSCARHRKPSRQRNRSPPSRSPITGGLATLGTLLPAFLLPFTAAAPPRHLPRQTSALSAPSPSPSTSPHAPGPTSLPRWRRDGREVKFITSAAPPSSLPAEFISVDATALPYIVSRGPDGRYTRVDEGWRLYGRQSGETSAPAPDPDSTQMTSMFAIEEALPPGWGVQSTRTDFYRVPLIVVASCIIAIGIVIAIIIIAFKRRKAHRRAKRRAERKRRKELAASGLTEEDVNDSRNQASMREKLDDLQRQHRVKKKGEAAVVSSVSARNKVRSWRAGLRSRRKGREEGDEGGAISAVEGKPESVERTDSQDTDRTTPTVPSVEPGEGSGSGSSGFGSRLDTVSSDDQSSTNRQSGSTDNALLGPQSDATAAVSGPGAVPGIAAATGTTYFPPAYRPASVHSAEAGSSSRAHATGSSSAPAPAPSPPDVGPTEKTRAPGYYPAPATAEGEIALAVASRSEGKSRMVAVEQGFAGTEHGEEGDGDGDGDVERERHRAHVATDDKRVLERMRMAASAPGQAAPREAGEEGDGPSASAPHVEVDEHGFEALPLDFEPSEPSASDPRGRPRPQSQPQLQTQAQAPRHPALPLPPAARPHFGRSYSVEREVHEQLDELNLLPSAPPLARSHSPLAVPASSAPPLPADEEELPSAPPLHLHEEEDEANVEGEGEHGLHRDQETRTVGEITQSPVTAPLAPPLDSSEDDPTPAARDTDAQPEPTPAHSTIAGPPVSLDPGAPLVPTHPTDASRRPSEAPSENRLFLPRYEP